MSTREILQIAVLVVMFIGVNVMFRRLRDDGASRVDDARPPVPPGPPVPPSTPPNDGNGPRDDDEDSR
jgi:hypothetical protein